MEKIFLFGASDHCKYTIDIIEQENKYSIAGIFDLKIKKGEEFYSYEVIGYLDELEKSSRALNINKGIIAIGDNYTRMYMVNKILEILPDFIFVNAIHPSVIIGKNTVLGIGCVFMAGVIINNDCIINNHIFIATNSSLDHDSSIGDFSSLSPGVITGGRVSIGKCTAIGIGATILHYISIGSNCVIGACSLVNKEVIDNSLVYGVPMKFIKFRNDNDKYL